MTVLETAKSYLHAGLSVIPIRADGSKAPTVPWKQFQEHKITQPQMALFTDQVGIAIVCGRVSGGLTVMDFETLEAFNQWEDLVRDKVLLDLLPTVLTGNGGVHVYLCCETVEGNQKLAFAVLDSEGNLSVLVETRGEGGYVLAPGSPAACHPSGNQYHLIRGPVIEETPMITALQYEDMMQAARSLDQSQAGIEKKSNEYVYNVLERSEGELLPGDDYNSKVNWQDVLVGWTYVGNNRWRRPGKNKGHSATSGWGENGQDLLCVFSSSVPILGPASGETFALHSKFSVYAALNHGGNYRDASQALRDQGYGSAGVLPAIEAFVEQITDSEVDPVLEKINVEFPVEVFELLPPLMKSLLDYNVQTAIRPQRELAIASMLPMFATVIGRKVQDVRMTRVNLMILALARSGAGKEHGRRVNKELLLATNFEGALGPERVGSHAGLVSSLVQHNPRLFQVDEIGRLLQTMKSPKNAPHLYNIATVLMSLYTSSNTLWTGDAYADVERVPRINQPHLCMLGTTLPSTFFESITASNLIDGFVGRLIPIVAPGDSQIETPFEQQQPQDVLEFIDRWVRFEPPGGGNLDRGAGTIMARHTQESMDRHMRYCKDIQDKGQQDDDMRQALWARAPEKAAKLALIHACLSSPGFEITIGIESVTWGIRLTNYSNRLILKSADDYLAESRHQSDLKYVWRKIPPVGQEIRMRQLLRSTQKLRRKELDEILKQLVLMKSIEVVEEVRKGNPSNIVRRLRNQLS